MVCLSDGLVAVRLGVVSVYLPMFFLVVAHLAVCVCFVLFFLSCDDLVPPLSHLIRSNSSWCRSVFLSLRWFIRGIPWGWSRLRCISCLAMVWSWSTLGWCGNVLRWFRPSSEGSLVVFLVVVWSPSQMVCGPSRDGVYRVPRPPGAFLQARLLDSQEGANTECYFYVFGEVSARCFPAPTFFFGTDTVPTMWRH